jgi:hypothetical protein
MYYKEHMKRILFLDDDANRYRVFNNLIMDSNHNVRTNELELDEFEVTWVETSKAAIKLLQDPEKHFHYVFLDHDLGGEVYVASGEHTGWEVANFINDRKLKFEAVILHTMNPIGADNMKQLIPESFHIPFCHLADLMKSQIIKQKFIDFI